MYRRTRSLNALSGVGQARFSGSPVVQVNGGPARGARRYVLHGLEDEGYTATAVGAVTKASFRPTSLSDLSRQLAAAFRIAREGRSGPVQVEVPLDAC